MAGSTGTSSSMTSTSHTLTHAPPTNRPSSSADPSRPLGAMEMLVLFETAQPSRRHEFLQPSASISNASLQLAKSTLDAYAGLVSDELQKRHAEANRKRKRADNGPDKVEALKIRKLHVDGFESGQVWQQAKRIITSTLQSSKDTLQELEARDQIRTNGVNGALNRPEPRKRAIEEDSGSSVEGSKIGADDDKLEDTIDVDDEYEQFNDESGDEEDLSAKETTEDVIGDNESSGESEDDEDLDGGLVEDANGLNDGFFSIDDFNKQTRMFESADARADPDVDGASDDDQIDWHTDPFAVAQSTNAKKSKSSASKDDLALGLEEESEEEENDEDDDEDRGPTFGDMDLDAPEGESDQEITDEDDEGDGGESNANEIYYKDFFAPPRRKQSKGRRPRKIQTNAESAPDNADIERAMADVRRDLFEDESEVDESEDALSDVSAGDPKSRRSAHERRQAKLAEEIRKLEAANVAKREWTMSGEATAIERPKDSLLEEDLDFEHVGKPIPVMTTEISESIEEMIKRRIIAQEFDEVIRRRPDASGFSASNQRRGLVDLDDTKAKQSLAEIYEEEHVKNVNPDSYVSKADEKLRKQEEEVAQMWKDVCANLDALSSWYYRPKPSAPTLNVISDIATISMEDAQPTTAQGVSGGDNALAPQEIYKASKDTAETGEVVAKNGLPTARQEMSREDKTRRRRREKERIRKAGGTNFKKPQGPKAQERSDTLKDLKRGGVKVINRKGEIVDMEGNKAAAKRVATGGSFKL